MDEVIIFMARDLFVAVVLIWVLTYFLINRSKRLEFVIALAAAATIALLLDKIAAALYFHPRPFTVSNVNPLIPHSADNGFPSGHTLLVMTLTTLIYFYHRRLAAAALILSLLVGAGRVGAHVHSWIDILGSIAIGIIAGYISVQIAKFIVSRSNARQLKDHHAPEEQVRHSRL